MTNHTTWYLKDGAVIWKD